MSRVVAGFDRAIFFLLGLVLIALGLWPILVHFNVEFAQYLALWIDHDAWAAAPKQQWWPWALGIGAGVTTLLAIWLIFLNLRVRKINKVNSEASTDQGSVVVHLAPITAAMTESLEEHPAILKASRKVAFDRKDPQLTVTLTAKPETPLAQLSSIVDSAEQDFREAFPYSELHTVYQVQYERITT